MYSFNIPNNIVFKIFKEFTSTYSFNAMTKSCILIYNDNNSLYHKSIFLAILLINQVYKNWRTKEKIKIFNYNKIIILNYFFCLLEFPR